MPISWNEIRQNAIRFSREWVDEHREDAEADLNIKAVEILGDLHDVLAEGGYAGHDLERFLVRILFCLFADDTGLFEPDTFKLYVENRTANDGSDLGMHLARLFDVRAMHPLATLADLYDPLTMPADLVKAHAELDRAVDLCYRSQPFTSDRQRVEFLFALYERYTAPLLPVEKKGRRK